MTLTQMHQVFEWASPETVERFMEKVTLPREVDGCWLWTAAHNGKGYGKFMVKNGGPVAYAHRVAWELWSRTRIPDGMQVDHMCRVRNCVNPAHLRVVTCQENLLASPYTRTSINLAKTHCANGHEFTPENTIRTKQGWRNCRICRKRNSDSSNARRKAASTLTSLEAWV